MNPAWLALVAVLWASAGWAAWPEIPAPPGSRVESIGEQVRLNGVPMRMQRVLSADKPKAVIEFYREALGTKRAEEKLPDGLLFAQGRGDYFVTVRVKALGPSLTETLISVSDAHAAQGAADRPLGFQLPADSQVLSDMESTDAGKRSRQLVLNNRHGIETNLQAFTRELAARGIRPDGVPLRKTAAEHVQLYKGDQREAQLTLVRKDSETKIVLTTILNP